MASKNSKDAYGASGKSNVLFFDPAKIKLIEDEKHPLYDERVKLPLDENLVKNIMHLGVLEPIIVTKDTETGETVCVVGRQRTKACREANKRLKDAGKPTIHLPGIVRRGDGASLASVMVSENEIRQDDSPITKAKKMARLQEMGRSEDDLAIIFGCTKATVKNTLGVLDCCAAVRDAVDDGKITATAAYALAKLDVEEQKEKLTKMVEAGATTNGKHAKSRAQKAAAGKDVRPSKKELVEYRADLMANCSDEDYKGIALKMLDFVLGKGGQPRFPKEKTT